MIRDAYDAIPAEDRELLDHSTEEFQAEQKRLMEEAAIEFESNSFVAIMVRLLMFAECLILFSIFYFGFALIIFEIIK